MNAGKNSKIAASCRLFGWRYVKTVLRAPRRWSDAGTTFRPGAPGFGAAPAGGAFGRRGCAIILTSLVIHAAPAELAAAEPVEVPSGIEISFHDIHRDTLGEGLTYRFRFLAPAIGVDGVDFLAVSSDMEYLCNEYALKRVSNLGPQPSRIVISLMQEVVEFGVSSPNVVQFFESYSIENDLCIWEVF